MSEWKEIQLGELIEFKNGFAFKSNDFIESGVPVIKIKNVKANNILLDNLSYVSKEVAVGKENYLIRPEDILITMSGNRSDGSPDSWVGKVALFKRQGTFLLNQRVSIIRVNEKKASVPFIAYILSSWQTQVYLINQANSSGGQANISPDIVKEMEILLPPLEEQIQIASILSSLDDKIDLLHRQNKTLEALSEALFRQWFVEEAEDGWETGKLGDVIELVYGKGLKEEIRTGRGFPVVGSSGVIGYHSEFLVEGPGIVIGRKGTLGKVVYLFENFFPIDTTYFIKSKVNSVGLFYEYFLLKTLNFEDMNSDSAVPGLNRDLALSTEIKIVPFDKLKQYNGYCASLFEKLKQNNSQIRTLSRLRDTLLPKLMSGEVRVKD